MGLSEEGKQGFLLKIVILKRVIDVVLVNGAEAQSCLAPSPSKVQRILWTAAALNVYSVMSGEKQKPLHQRFPVGVWALIKKIPQGLMFRQHRHHSQFYIIRFPSTSADIRRRR